MSTYFSKAVKRSIASRTSILLDSIIFVTAGFPKKSAELCAARGSESVDMTTPTTVSFFCSKNADDCLMEVYVSMYQKAGEGYLLVLGTVS
jgi:hypothetical protein